MQSVIYDFFVKKLKNLSAYFPHSILGKVFFAICDFIRLIISGSLIGKFLKKRPNGKELLKNSLFGKLILLPINIAESIGKKISDQYSSIQEGSKLLYLLSNWNLISTRIYGGALLSFGAVYGLFRIITDAGTLIILCACAFLVIVGLILILVNRSLKSLFKGSALLKAVANLFYDGTSNEHSKLFLENDNINIKGFIISVIIGIVSAIITILISPLNFALAIFCPIALICILKYTHLGVFITTAAAPVLPTMVLAGLCVLCAVSFIFRLLKDKNFKFHYSPLYVPTALFALSYVIGTLTSFTLMSSAQILLLHLAFMIFYVILYNSLKDEKIYKAITSFFVITGAFIALYGIAQNLFGITGTESWVDENMFQNIKLRVYSTFGNPNVLGEYLVLLIPIAMAFVLRTEKPSHKFIYFCALAVMALCLILTWSRGAWLGVMLSIMIFLVLTDKRWLLCALIIVVVIPFIPVLLSSNSAIIGRFTSIGNMADSSTAYRVSIWRSTIQLIKDYWISGIGPGSSAFSLIYQNYAASGADFALHSHNLYLQIITELGISGIIIFIGLILSYTRTSLQNIFVENKKTLKVSIATACLSGIAGLLLQGMTDYIWYNYKLLLIFWIVIAIGNASVNDNNTNKGGGV